MPARIARAGSRFDSRWRSAPGDRLLWIRIAVVAMHTRSAPRVCSVWLVGEGIAVAAEVAECIAGSVELGIAEAIAADAGRGRLALLHRVEAAAGHVSGYVLAAIFAGTCAACGDCAKGTRANNCGDHECRSRRLKFPECSHLFVSFLFPGLAQSPRPGWVADQRYASAFNPC